MTRVLLRSSSCLTNAGIFTFIQYFHQISCSIQILQELWLLPDLNSDLSGRKPSHLDLLVFTSCCNFTVETTQGFFRGTDD